MTASAVERAHEAAATVLRQGDWAVDATVGRGKDTQFLAEQVGPAGRVDGVDIQAQALDAARERLAQAGLADRVGLHHGGHEELAALLPAAAWGKVRVVLFNLGYLPGGNKARVTQPHTTLTALEAAWGLVAPGGRVVVVAYPGHRGGAAETAALAEWAERNGTRATMEDGDARQRRPRLLILEVESQSVPLVSRFPAGPCYD